MKNSDNKRVGGKAQSWLPCLAGRGSARKWNDESGTLEKNETFSIIHG